MRDLYPGWKWSDLDKKTRRKSALPGDTSFKVRYPEDVSSDLIIGQALTLEDFWRPLWSLVRGACSQDQVVFADLGPFMRVSV